MLFNSLQFLGFFIIVFAVYALLRPGWQNRMLLLANYVFYAAWDWRFLALLIAYTAINYCAARKIQDQENQRRRRQILVISLILNLGILGFFKYFNFFIENLAALANVFGLHPGTHSLNIILPLGISFFAFQTMGYTIDVYRKEIPAEKNLLTFAIFGSFFPLLLSGPIERAKRLLPQIRTPRKITADTVFEGAHLFFWGMFQKIFIADNLGRVVDAVCSQNPLPAGDQILLATYAFTLQIFSDFSGYTDMARGISRMLGFDIMINFNLPFFVTNPQEYWNRWHISLSSWVRDYIYFPTFIGLKFLFGNTKVYISIIVAMFLMGLWHGAAWNYILWGIYNGVILLLYTLLRPRVARWFNFTDPRLKNIFLGIRILWMFQITAMGMLIFRSPDLAQLLVSLQSLFGNFHFSAQTPEIFLKILAYSAVLLLVMAGQWKTNDLLFLWHRHWIVRTLCYAVMTHLLLGWGVMTEERFIYFQF